LTTVLSPPFCWNWNRQNVSFLAATGTQDYAQNVATFGFIEKASYVAAASITNTVLTSGVATYTVSPAFLTASSFQVGVVVSVNGTTNGAGIFNVAQQPITAITVNTFSVAITSGNVGSAADTGTALAGKVAEIPGVQGVLGTGNDAGAPVYIAAQTDDNAGSITFRLLPIPDQPYQLNVIYQKRIPTLMTGPTSTWAPIPDHYSVIYQWGFLSVIAAYFDDPRWAGFTQKFVATILGMAEGLEETQRDIFQKSWLDMISEQQSRGIRTQQGISMKGV